MQTKRKFIPGEEWLYMKIYTGPEMMETILLAVIHDVVLTASQDGLIDNFFFIRYADEDGTHLRARFHLKDVAATGPLMLQLSKHLQPYIHKRYIFKVVYDTYTRELERYGDNTMEPVEILFGHNSWFIADQLKTAMDTSQPDKRWTWGAAYMDCLLSMFGYDTAGKHTLCESYYQLYTKEFGNGKNTRDTLSRKYRSFSGEITAAMAASVAIPATTPYFQGHEVQEAIQAIRERLGDGPAGEKKLHDLLSSVLHMHCNRLFNSQQRASEFVMYYLLSKLYKSFSVREQQAGMLREAG